MRFKQDILIPFHLVDAAGIMFFAHVFTLAHQAWEQCIIHSLKIAWSQWFQNPEWIVPVKHVEADYEKPLFSGSLCQIELEILEIKTSSFTISYHFYQQGLKCCTIKMTHIFCDRLSGKKRDIPAGIRAVLES